MDTETLNALFTVQSLLSLQGSAAAALLVPDVIGYLVGDTFNPYKKWVSFGLAMLLAYLVAFLAPSTDWFKWVLSFFNGFLAFASAVGINQAASGGKMGVKGGGRQFFGSWLSQA
jgi:hypothetical protein